MNPMKTRDIESGLLRKGFRRSERHHTYYFLYVDGLKTSIRTKISRGEREYGEPLLGQMSKQLGLDRQQFHELVTCPMSAEDYRQHLAATDRI